MKLAILLLVASAQWATALPRPSKGIHPNIVGGGEAVAHSAPHQISLQLEEGGSWYHLCGGAIVEADKIFTTANCIVEVDPTRLRVVAGDHDLTLTEGTEQIAAVASTVYHPYFRAENNDFDYAVVRLTKPLTLNANVATIALPPQKEYLPTGDCISTGWGSSSSDGETTIPVKLQQVTVPSIAQADCFKLYEGLNEMTARMICAGAAGKGACNGDWGSPLVCNGVLAGLVSFNTIPCGDSKFPGVYANIAPALGWYANN